MIKISLFANYIHTSQARTRRTKQDIKT